MLSSPSEVCISLINAPKYRIIMPPTEKLVMDIISGRRTIRRFKDKNVPISALEKIADAGRWAPSACNLQHWQFVAVTERALMERICSEGRAQKLILNAPALIAVFCNVTVSPENNANIQSCAAAIQNMALMAYTIGLGTGWVAGFDKPGKISNILNVPVKYRLIALLMVGYPAEFPKAPPRNPIKNIFHLNSFTESSSEFPATLDPQKWTLQQIAEYRARIARRGGIFENISPEKLEEVFSFVSAKIPKGNVIDMDSFSGIFLSRMQSAKGNYAYGQFASKEQIDAALMHTPGLKNKNLFAGRIQAKNNSAVTSFYRLEHMPSKMEMIRNAYSILPKGGKLIIVTRNSVSWYGLWDALHFRKKAQGISSRYFLGLQHMGPWKLASSIRLKKLLKNAGFSSVRMSGMYVLPAVEIANTSTFKNKLFWLSPVLWLLKKTDLLLAKAGIARYIGETIIAEAQK